MKSRSKKMTPIALAVVVDSIAGKKSVLLVRRATEDAPLPTWVFPGGKIERGENYLHAAKRELREEAGIEAVRPVLIGDRHHPISGAKTYYVGFKKYSDFLDAHDEKIAERRWVPVDHLDDYLGRSLYQKVANYLKVGHRATVNELQRS